MNKTILITGATDGIGKQTAYELALKGASVIVHGRNKERAEKACAEISKRTGSNSLTPVYGDFSSLNEVRKLADDVKSKFNGIDVLINNAGVYMREVQKSADGFEMSFAVNHLAPFLLTNLLLDLLKSSAPSRIINVSSMAHHRAKFDPEDIEGLKRFSPYGNYSLSKLYNILFTKKLAEKLEGTGVTVNALHPGVITTKLLKTGFGMTGSSLEKGAETSVYLAISDEVAGVTGEYFDNKKPSQISKDAANPRFADILWEKSEDLSGINS